MIKFSLLSIMVIGVSLHGGAISPSETSTYKEYLEQLEYEDERPEIKTFYGWANEHPGWERDPDKNNTFTYVGDIFKDLNTQIKNIKEIDGVLAEEVNTLYDLWRINVFNKSPWGNYYLGNDIDASPTNPDNVEEWDENKTYNRGDYVKHEITPDYFMERPDTTNHINRTSYNYVLNYGTHFSTEEDVVIKSATIQPSSWPEDVTFELWKWDDENNQTPSDGELIDETTIELEKGPNVVNLDLQTDGAGDYWLGTNDKVVLLYSRRENELLFPQTSNGGITFLHNRKFDEREITPSRSYIFNVIVETVEGEKIENDPYYKTYYCLEETTENPEESRNWRDLWYTKQGWKPIGIGEVSYRGYFNGEGHTISNLYSNRIRNVGLFGYVGLNGVVKNVNVENANISGKGYYGESGVGILIGKIRLTAEVINCHTSGTVTGISQSAGIGGLIGAINNAENSKIINSSSSANINQNGFYDWYYGYAGGLIGFMRKGGIVERCHATGNVEGDHIVGGLVGQNMSDGESTESYATGDVFVRNSKGGGLVGENRNSARISNSYATGNVQGDETIGGLVGVNWIQGYIENTTYSIGEVNGETEIGGFVGRQGPHGSNVDDGFWDIETSKIETSDGGIGKTTDELMSYETFEDWDISRESELDMESPTIWSIVENEEYPKLTVE